MNEQLVAEAIEAALPAVAALEAYPPGTHPNSDLAIVSRLTDVGVQDETTFRQLVATLRSQPELEALQGKLFAVSFGFFVGPIHLEHLAKSMLAQVLNGRGLTIVLDPPKPTEEALKQARGRLLRGGGRALAAWKARWPELEISQICRLAAGSRA